MVQITNSNQTFEMKWTTVPFSKLSHYKYLIVDDIYELAKLASEYNSYTKTQPSIYYTSLATHIEQNNTKNTEKLPEKFIQNIKDVINQFRNIEIGSEFKKEKDLNFTLISKQLLKRKRFLKFIPFFTKSLTKADFENIRKMIKDIFVTVYKYEYNFGIALPITSNDIDFHDYYKENKFDCDIVNIERRLKAYDVIGIKSPITTEQLLDEKAYIKRQTFRNIWRFGKAFCFVIGLFVLAGPVICFIIILDILSYIP